MNVEILKLHGDNVVALNAVKEKIFIRESAVTEFLKNSLGIISNGIEFICIGMPLHLYRFTSYQQFYDECLKPNLSIILSSNKRLTQSDAITDGLYVVVRDNHCFKKITQYSSAVIKNISFDADSPISGADEAYAAIARSIYTKNKCIALHPNVDFNILFSTRESAEKMMHRLNSLNELI